MAPARTNLLILNYIIWVCLGHTYAYTTVQESYTLQTAGTELIPMTMSKFSKTIGRAIQLTRPYSNSNSRGKEYQGHENRSGSDESPEKLNQA